MFYRIDASLQLSNLLSEYSVSTLVENTNKAKKIYFLSIIDEQCKFFDLMRHLSIEKIVILSKNEALTSSFY